MNTKQFARNALNEAIKSNTRTAQRCREETNTLKAHRSEMLHVTSELLNYLGTNRTDLDKPRVNCYFTVGYDRPRIHVSVYNADGFRDDSLMMAMTHLMTVGFESSGKTYENAEYLNREYKFSRADLDVVLDISVRSDSETCRRVAIGEETVKQTKYQIQCD